MSRKRVGLLGVLIVVALALVPPGQVAGGDEWSIFYESPVGEGTLNGSGTGVVGGVTLQENQFASAWYVLEGGTSGTWAMYWKCGAITYASTSGSFNGQPIRLYGPWITDQPNAPNLGLIGTSGTRSCSLSLRHSVTVTWRGQDYVLARLSPGATLPPGGNPGATNPPSPSPSPSGQTPAPTTTPGPTNGYYCDPSSGYIGPCEVGPTPVPTLCVVYIPPATPAPWNAPSCAPSGSPTPSPTPEGACVPGVSWGPGSFTVTTEAYSSSSVGAVCKIWEGLLPGYAANDTVTVVYNFTIVKSGSGRFGFRLLMPGQADSVIFTQSGYGAGTFYRSGTWTMSTTGAPTGPEVSLWFIGNGYTQFTVQYSGSYTVSANGGGLATPSPAPTSTGGPTPTPTAAPVCPPGQAPGPVSGSCKPAIPYKPGQDCPGPWPSVNPLDYAMWTGCLLGQVVGKLEDLAAAIVNGLTDLLVPGEGLGAGVQEFVTDISSLAPFGYVSQVDEALSGAMAGAAGADWSLAFTLPWFAPEDGGGTREVALEVPTDIADGLAQYRWVLAALVWIMGAVAVLRVLMRAVGGGGSVE